MGTGHVEGGGNVVRRMVQYMDAGNIRLGCSGGGRASPMR